MLYITEELCQNGSFEVDRASNKVRSQQPTASCAATPSMHTLQQAGTCFIDADGQHQTRQQQESRVTPAPVAARPCHFAGR